MIFGRRKRLTIHISTTGGGYASWFYWDVRESGEILSSGRSTNYGSAMKSAKHARKMLRRGVYLNERPNS
jgi:hypothetical protein